MIQLSEKLCFSEARCLIKHMYTNSRSVETVDDIGEQNPKLLTPVSKLVYKQWKMDNNDELLIDGYYRQKCNLTQNLSPDIRQLIADYYVKSQSKGAIKRKIVTLTEIARKKRGERQRKTDKMLEYLIIFIIFVTLFALVFGVDISALIVISLNDCDLALQNGSTFVNFGISNYMLLGSVSHIITVLAFAIGAFFFLQCTNAAIEGLVCCGTMIICAMMSFFISWSVVGAIMYSEMHQSTASNKVISVQY